MATESIKKQGYILNYSSKSISGQSVNANAGTNIQVPITVPSGYNLIGHVGSWVSGAAAMVCTIDPGNLQNTNPSVYVYNTRSSTQSFGTDAKLNVLSLFELA